MVSLPWVFMGPCSHAHHTQTHSMHRTGHVRFKVMMQHSATQLVNMYKSAKHAFISHVLSTQVHSEYIRISYLSKQKHDWASMAHSSWGEKHACVLKYTINDSVIISKLCTNIGGNLEHVCHWFCSRAENRTIALNKRWLHVPNPMLLLELSIIDCLAGSPPQACLRPCQWSKISNTAVPRPARFGMGRDGI